MFQCAVIEKRIAVVTDYIERLKRGDATYVLVMEGFIDCWMAQERFIRAWEGIPGINDPVAANYVPWASHHPLWRFGGCPDTEPFDLRGRP